MMCEIASMHGPKIVYFMPKKTNILPMWHLVLMFYSGMIMLFYFSLLWSISFSFCLNFVKKSCSTTPDLPLIFKSYQSYVHLQSSKLSTVLECILQFSVSPVSKGKWFYLLSQIVIEEVVLRRDFTSIFQRMSLTYLQSSLESP